MRDLMRINFWFGGRCVLPSILRHFVRRGDRFSILDVGAGFGDIGRVLRSRFPNASVISVDRRPEYLKAAPPPRVAADALHLPFRDGSFDFVTCSLTLHHFPDERIVHLLTGFRRLAGRAVIVVDLERHVLAYYFIPATRWLFRWHELSMHDACASVQAAFLPEELKALARAAGAPNPSVRRHFPWFRLSLVLSA